MEVEGGHRDGSGAGRTKKERRKERV